MSAVEEITELMMAGHTVDYACEKGAVGGGWRRTDVLAVVEHAGWELDRSGRIPFHLRRGSTARGRGGRVRSRPPAGRVPVAPLPPEPQLVVRQEEVGESYHLAGPDGFCIGGCPAPGSHVQAEPSSAVQEEDTSSPGGLSGGYLGYDGVIRPWGRTAAEVRAEQILDEAAETAAKTPTNEGAALITAAETAPDEVVNEATNESGHRIAGPDAQPQVSPSRTRLGEDGGPGASEAPAAPPVAPIDVLAVGLAHPDPRVQAKARYAQAAIDALCTALLWSGGPRG